MTQADIAGYLTWTEPDTSFQVHYSLPVFHEIDSTVSEGYRRIPYGGIEVGGLLFGRSFPGGVRVETFRPIECEHAHGPSFKLSERDIAGLRQQIDQAGSDPELNGLETVGWFIAHTRGPLALTEAEAVLFGELLPGTGKMTVLVKPEKFKPTLFAFLIRGKNGVTNSDATDRAIILPLPGRAGRAVDAAPLPGPAVIPEVPRFPQPELRPEPAPVLKAPVHEPPINAPEPAPTTSQSSSSVAPPPAAAQPFQWQFDRTPTEPPPLFSEYSQMGGRKVRREAKPQGTRKGAAIMAILIAALLGAGAGYWFYQQMPAPIIQLTIEPQQTGVLVSWPPDQTADSAHAFVRVNDGPMLELPSDAKVSGHWQVQAKPDNLKVEIIAQHYLRDCHGIIRYIQPATAP